MQRRNFLGKTAVLTAGIAGLAGCGSPDGPANESEAGTDTEAVGTDTEMGSETESAAETETGDSIDIEGMVGESPDNIEVSNTELQLADGNAVVTGTIENTGDQMIDQVEVQVTLLDDNDELIGQFFHDTEQSEMDSLDAGATWDFSVSFPEEDLEDAASYRVDVDTNIDQNVDFNDST